MNKCYYINNAVCHTRYPESISALLRLLFRLPEISYFGNQFLRRNLANILVMFVSYKRLDNCNTFYEILYVNYVSFGFPLKAKSLEESRYW